MHAYLSTQGGDLAPDGPGPSGAAAALPLFPSPRALPHFLPPLDAALDLDWFAVDPLLFETDPGLGAQAPAGRLAAAPQAQAGPAAVYTHQAGAALRCLDPSHADGCTSCTAAPPPEQGHLYALVGDPGRKNGEKLLKSLLLRTAEWGSPEARLALAERCQGGYPGLARVLRREATSAQLRKADYLEACRAWGYRSSLWQLKPCLDVPGAEVGTWERAVRRRKA